MIPSFFLWIVLYGYSFLVFVVSVIPVSGPQVLTNQDKIIHFFLYMVMASLAVLARKSRPDRFVLMPAFLYAASFGLVVEIVQYFLPYRSFEWWDILANTCGAFFAVLLARLVRYA